MKQVVVTTPGKLMLSGSYAVVYGWPCVATAVDQYLSVTIRPVAESVLEVEAPDVNVTGWRVSLNELNWQTTPKGARFVVAAVQQWLKLHPQSSGGWAIQTHAQFTAEYGLGSSSAVTAGVVQGMAVLQGRPLGNEELFHQAFEVVQTVQGVGSGYDLAVAIWGGTIKYITPGLVIEPLFVSQLPLVIAYSGTKAETAPLIRQVAAQYLADELGVGGVFESIGKVSDTLAVALAEGEWELAGQLLIQHHRLTQVLGISTPKLDALVAAATAGGALGASLSGAGGGDCVIALATPTTQSRVKAKLVAAGGTILEATPNAQGLRFSLEEYE